MGITTTKEEFETQSEYLKGRRIEENNKLRSIIRERVASSKESESIFRSLYNKIPTNVRLLVENLTGVDRPITAADFTEDELVEMIFLAEKTKQANKKREEVVQDVLTDKAYTPDAETKEYLQKVLASFQKTRGKTSVSPYGVIAGEVQKGGRSNTGPHQVDKGFLDSAYSSFTDPRYVVATSLGKYNVYDDEVGLASKIRDTYNFNKEERNLPTGFRKVLGMMITSPEYAGEYLANFLGTEDRDVNIDLPLQMSTGGMATRDNSNYLSFLEADASRTGTTPYFDPAPQLTADEYQKRFVDFYDFGGIKVDPIDVDDTKEEDTEVVANVLMPVGSDNDRDTIFGSGTSLTGGPTFTFNTVTPEQYLAKYNDKKNAAQTKTGGDKVKGFQDYLMSDEGILGGVVGVMGLPAVGGLMAAAGYKNRENQKKTADAILATDNTGGAMFELNGQTVYRAPGSTQYSGTYDGPSSQLLGMEAITNGFIPGTFKEVAVSQTFQNVITNTNKYEKSGLTALHASPSTMTVIDSYGNTLGSDGTMFSVSAGQATKARNEYTRKVMAEKGYTASQMAEATKGKRDLSQQLKQALNAHMEEKFPRSFFSRTSDLTPAQIAERNKAAKEFSSDFIEKRIGPSSSVAAARKAAMDEITRTQNIELKTQQFNEDVQAEFERLKSEREAQRVREEDVYRMGLGPRPEKTSVIDDIQSDKGGAPSGAGSSVSGRSGGMNRGYRALGGRVGLQEGGVAAAPAGFVERPPSQVSEAATVADDKPMSVPEGTFVINAAAVEFAGEEDIIEMLNVAYKKASKKGIKPPSRETLEVAVSRGEVIVPPFLAKIIGYDRLEKINNRGKKEVNQRIKENGQRPVEAAGGGFLTRKKFAEGDTVTPPVLPKPDKPITLPARKPLSPRQEALRMADEELRMDLEEFIKDDNLAKLGWDLFTSGDLRLIGMPLPRGAARTNFGGTFYPPKGKETIPIFPQDGGYSEAEKAQREKVATAGDAGRITKSIMDKLGIVLDSDMPTATYFAETMYIDKDNRTDINKFKSDRAAIFITLAHELRHAALNHLKFDYGVRELTYDGEENLMDYFDYKARRTASKSNPLVSETPLRKSAKSKTKLSTYSKFNKDMYEKYNKAAGVILEERGYLMPEEKKGFVTKFMDRLVSAPRPGGSKLRESKGKPVDYEAQAYLQ